MLEPFEPSRSEAVVVFKKQYDPDWYRQKRYQNIRDIPLRSYLYTVVPEGIALTIDDVAGEMMVSAKGNLSIKDVIDSLGGEVYVEANDSSLTVKGFITRTFEIPQFPVQYSYSQNYISSGVQTQTSSSGQPQAGSLQSNINIASQQNFWADIKNEVMAIIGDTGTSGAQQTAVQQKISQGAVIADSTSVTGMLPAVPRQVSQQPAAQQSATVSGGAGRVGKSFVAINPVTSTVMVGTTVAKMRNVEDYFKKLISRLGEAVEVELAIIEVSDKNNVEFGLSWVTTLRSMLFPSSVFDAAVPDARVSFFGNGSQLSTASGEAFGMKGRSLTNPDQQNFILNALKKVANVRVVEKTTILLRNNSAGGFATGTSFSYIDSISQTTAGLSGTTSTSVTKGTILSGIDITMSATINNDNITLTILPSISQLKEMQTVSVGGITVQNPTVEMRKSIATVTVKNGETTAIIGYNNKSTGTVKDSFPILGDLPVIGWLFGKKLSLDESASVVMLITPRIKTL